MLITMGKGEVALEDRVVGSFSRMVGACHVVTEAEASGVPMVGCQAFPESTS